MDFLANLCGTYVSDVAVSNVILLMIFYENAEDMHIKKIIAKLIFENPYKNYFHS